MNNALTAPVGGELWRLDGQLFELFALREEVGSRRAVPGALLDVAMAELKAIDTAIADFVAQKASEVDEVRGPILAMRSAAGVCRADAAKSEGRALAWDRRADKVEFLLQQCMQTLAESGYWKPNKPRKFESARGTLTLKGNGGAAPVVIADEALIPDEYKRVTVTMRAALWGAVLDADFGVDEINREFRELAVRREVSRSAIAEALNQACPACAGAPGECTDCGGSGKAGVPGAYLDSRGSSVVIR